MMINDRQITISAGASRKATVWRPQTLLISELYERLRVPARGTESLAEYLALKKPQQDERKDVGGFVGGTLTGPRRKANNVSGRDLLTLDLDSIPAGGTEDVLRRIEGLGCGYCVYSTRKHSPAAPRLRVLIPLDRTVTADEYEPVIRRMAEYIGLTLTDPTTFEASRLMYWPSCCADSEYIYTCADKPLLSGDGMLETYADWHDMSSWPQVPGAQVSPARLAAKQGDPETKNGAVGAFCRTYDIFRAIDTFLPGVYEPTDIPDRYTFTGGSTTGGAIIYDNGKYLYSHHATDPCGGRLVNAFDLVRLHRFADLDDEADPGTPTNRLPSYPAMCELAVGDKDTAAALARERYGEAAQDFEGVAPDNGADPANWMGKLSIVAQTGLPTQTIDNAWIILENDPALAGKFALNAFAGRGEVLGALPWKESPNRRFWDDNDNFGLYWYFEKKYQFTKTAKIDGALALHSERHAFNEVQDFLGALQWDGTPRLDTLLVDYLGAADTPYIRAVTRKSFTAAVARAMAPGIKFDNMTILSGPQGIGKSTLLRKMAMGWFTDSIRTFEGKEASELLQGVWLVEVGELDAFRRTDVSRIKQFLSLQVDRFRAAYGRHVKDLPRCCVFFGSTNSPEYLQDKTGNRRFWPVDVGIRAPIKNVWRDLDGELHQIWAEAKMRWQMGEPLYLEQELDAAAKEIQEEHRERSPQEGIILEFLDQEVPEDWDDWGLPQRLNYWNGVVTGEIRREKRSRICAAEVWCEAIGEDLRRMRNSDAAEINSVIAMSPGWKRMKKIARFGPYKQQRGFEKFP